MSVINRLDASSVGFGEQLAQLLAYDETQDAQIEQVVSEIIADVRARGDAAVLEYSLKFDGVQAESMAELEISQAQCQAALEGLPEEQRQALMKAAERIRRYHEHQKKARAGITRRRMVRC